MFEVVFNTEAEKEQIETTDKRLKEQGIAFEYVFNDGLFSILMRTQGGRCVAARVDATIIRKDV
jgi:hypothetical protein